MVVFIKIIIFTLFLSFLFSKENLSLGKEIYKTCAICHGKNGDKRALEVSLPISGRNINRIISELNAYKKNTLNIHGMGQIMLSIMPKLSEKDIENVSKYINSMGKPKK